MFSPYSSIHYWDLIFFFCFVQVFPQVSNGTSIVPGCFLMWSAFLLLSNDLDLFRVLCYWMWIWWLTGSLCLLFENNLSSFLSGWQSLSNHLLFAFLFIIFFSLPLFPSVSSSKSQFLSISLPLSLHLCLSLALCLSLHLSVSPSLSVCPAASATGSWVRRMGGGCVTEECGVIEWTSVDCQTDRLVLTVVGAGLTSFSPVLTF